MLHKIKDIKICVSSCAQYIIIMSDVGRVQWGVSLSLSAGVAMVPQSLSGLGVSEICVSPATRGDGGMVAAVRQRQDQH